MREAVAVTVGRAPRRSEIPVLDKAKPMEAQSRARLLASWQKVTSAGTADERFQLRREHAKLS
eukprot:8630460-Karenia_brevis.AAC.1